MSSETEIPDIPEQIEELMQSDELGNMRNLCGWAVGDVVEVNPQGKAVESYSDAWVELFNGEGRAGRFGGVRFMVVSDGEYEEAYAYPDEESAHGNEPCYYVTEWIVPDQPDVGIKKPTTPGVQ
jgi:hypothetical protein